MIFRFSFSLLLFTYFAHAQWFFGNSLYTGSSFSKDYQVGAKLYVQNDAFPAVTLTGGYTYFNWIQSGVTYTQSGTDYAIGANQPISQNGLSLGIGATLWAKGNFYVDVEASYIFLQTLTFAAPIQDATFPTSGYEAQVGVGYNLNSFSLRPYYSFISFAQDYIVLNQIMLPLTQQHTFGLELIYWY